MKKMMLRGPLLLLMFVSLFAATSCSDDDDINNDRLTAQSFMQQAAASDMFEIQTGEMATQKGSMNEIKTFGQQLINDHTLTSTELKALAQQKNVTLPQTLPQDKQTMKTRLEGLSGNAFDKEFATTQITAHQQAVALFEKAISDVNDAQVKSFAERHVGHLRMHLQEAQRLNGMLN